MLSNVALLSSLLLVPAVLAVPSALGSSVARHSERFQSQLNSHIGRTVDAVSDTLNTSNWAGAAVVEGDGTFTRATGTLTVPALSGSDGDMAAAWVGIDGLTCQSALLQAVIVFIVSPDGPGYSAWCQWIPNDAISFSNITISAGDVIILTVEVVNATTAVASVENLTKGEKVGESLSSDVPLCGQDAEWIVEDFENTSGTGFADFGTITFTDAVAGNYTPSDATPIDIVQNNQVLASTTISGDSVIINYV